MLTQITGCRIKQIQIISLTCYFELWIFKMPDAVSYITEAAGFELLPSSSIDLPVSSVKLAPTGPLSSKSSGNRHRANYIACAYFHPESRRLYISMQSHFEVAFWELRASGAAKKLQHIGFHKGLVTCLHVARLGFLRTHIPWGSTTISVYPALISRASYNEIASWWNGDADSGNVLVYGKKSDVGLYQSWATNLDTFWDLNAQNNGGIINSCTTGWCSWS